MAMLVYQRVSGNCQRRPYDLQQNCEAFGLLKMLSPFGPFGLWTIHGWSAGIVYLEDHPT